MCAADEVHSTVLSIWFYYGIVPWLIWLVWCAKQVKGIKRSARYIYFAIGIECLTLINQRQPFFWMLLVLASHSVLKDDFEREAQEEGAKEK